MTSSILKSRSLFLYGRGGGGSAGLLDRRLLTSTILQSSPSSTSAAATGRPIGGSSSSSFHQSQEKERGIWSKLCLFIPGAIAFGLGSWQIFRSVQLLVLVNRGWVPRSWRDKFFEGIKDAMQYTEPPPSTLQAERNPWWKIWSKISERNEEEAPVATNLKEVVGVIHGSERPSIFVPANDPRSGQWFYVDVPAIADASGLPHEIIYIEDIDSNVNPSNPYPIPKDVNTLIRTSVLPHDHLNYIITWYSLSTAVTVMAYKRQKTTKRRF